MKKNVEKIERTVVDEKITWIACDGTVFESEDNCKEYEDTCKCKVMTLLAKVEKKEFSPVEDFPIPYGMEDDHIEVYNIKTKDDVDALIMYLAYMKGKHKVCIYESNYPTYDYVGELCYLYYNFDDEICECKLVKDHIREMNEKYNVVLNAFNTIEEKEKGDTKDGD